MNSSAFAELWHNYLNQPKEVSLETFAYCNAACTFCPYPTLERIGQKMPDQLIARLIGEMATWEQPFHFAPFKLNEPFLDKRLEDICRKFNDLAKAGTLRLFTNGSALTEKNLRWVADLPKIEHLWISLNEHRADEYKALMALSFERTTKNLDTLHQMVERGEFRHNVVVSRVGQNFDFQHYCHNRWPLFAIQVIKKDAWLGFTKPDDPRIPPSPCIRWFELSVMADGKVSHCCMHDGTNPAYNIGDLNNQTLLEVYNSPFWRERREKLVSRKSLDDRSPCRSCSY